MPSTHSLSCAALLFDLDGVLVDSAECVERTWRNWAVRHRLDPDRVIELAHGRRTLETVKLVAPRLAAFEEVAILAAMESRTTDGVYEVAGARELLERLPASAWGIVTSALRAVALLRIRHANLPMPPVFVRADEVQRGKPDPEGYMVAAHRLGVAAADCVVIEDAPAGLEAARSAGMRAIGVCGTYQESSLALADFVVPRFSALHVDVPGDQSPLEISMAVG